MLDARRRQFITLLGGAAPLAGLNELLQKFSEPKFGAIERPRRYCGNGHLHPYFWSQVVPGK